MYCPNCGNVMDDNAAFCPQCGYATVVPNQQDQQKPVKKYKLFGLGAFILCLVMLLIGFINVKNAGLHNIPVVSMFVSDAKADLDDANEPLLDAIDEIEEIIEESDLTSKEKAYLEGLSDASKKFVKNVSINSIKNLMDNAENIPGDFDDELDEIVDMLDVIDELQKIIKVIEKVILWFVLIPMAFTVLGGLLRSKGWTIIALITALPFFFLLGGAVWGIIAIAGYIAQVVFYGKLKKAKRAAAAAA